MLLFGIYHQCLAAGLIYNCQFSIWVVITIKENISLLSSFTETLCMRDINTNLIKAVKIMQFQILSHSDIKL